MASSRRERPTKVGAIADQSGALSFVGLAPKATSRASEFVYRPGAQGGRFQIVKSLGAIDPQKWLVAVPIATV